MSSKCLEVPDAIGLFIVAFAPFRQALFMYSTRNAGMPAPKSLVPCFPPILKFLALDT